MMLLKNSWMLISLLVLFVSTVSATDKSTQVMIKANIDQSRFKHIVEKQSGGLDAFEASLQCDVIVSLLLPQIINGEGQLVGSGYNEPTKCQLTSASQNLLGNSLFKDFIEATTEKAVRAIRIRTKGYTLAELKELPKQPLMVKFIGEKVRYFASKDSILVGGNIAALTDAEFQQTPTFPEKSIQLLKPIDSLSTSFVTRIAVGKKLISSKEEFNATLDCSLSYKLDNFTPQQGAGALIFQSTTCELLDANPSIMTETGIAKGIIRNTERFLANGKLNLVFQGYTEEEVKANLLSTPQDIQVVYTGTDTQFIVKSSSFLLGLSSVIKTTN